MAPTAASPVVLASGSVARRQMLAATGLHFSIVPADIDEAALRCELDRQHPEGIAPPAEVALALATAKARAVSLAQPDAIVIGGDQVLALGDRLFAKPSGRAEAREQLLELRGKPHVLFSAAAIVSDGRAEWSQVTSARLAMRAFSDRFLDAYLDEAGEAVCSSVGAYQIEGPGVQLFDVIDGDHFTILGLPLLPLLAELRERGVLAV